MLIEKRHTKNEQERKYTSNDLLEILKILVIIILGYIIIKALLSAA